LLIRVFPAAEPTKLDFETLGQIQINALKLNSVQAVLVNEFIEHMSEVFPVRTGGKERRKVLRAPPTSEGDDGFHILRRISDGGRGVQIDIHCYGRPARTEAVVLYQSL
jgi:hypothetical protein